MITTIMFRQLRYGYLNSREPMHSLLDMTVKPCILGGEYDLVTYRYNLSPPHSSNTVGPTCVTLYIIQTIYTLNVSETACVYQYNRFNHDDHRINFYVTCCNMLGVNRYTGPQFNISCKIQQVAPMSLDTKSNLNSHDSEPGIFRLRVRNAQDLCC